MTGAPILAARSVSKVYPGRSRDDHVRALDGVDVEVRRGQTLGIVGESGSGKSTLMRLLLDLEGPSSGSVEYQGCSIAALSRPQRREYRRAVGAVFQNPYSSLDPRMRVWEVITEKQAIEGQADGPPRRSNAAELLPRVGLDPTLAERFPHQLSGGQRQRVAIARAIAQQPEVILLDEPLAALDVSVGAQVLNLLLDLQVQLDLTYVFIGHDLNQIRHLSHRVVVMHGGRVIETATADEVLLRPRHPYTAALMEASALRTLADEREVPDSSSFELPATGCAYRQRCPHAQADCAPDVPALVAFGDDHFARCIHPLGTATGSPSASSNLDSTPAQVAGKPLGRTSL